MTDPFLTLARARLHATGVELDARLPVAPPLVNSEPEFDSLVTAYYKFFREEIAIDVSVLRQVSNGPRVTEFDRVLKDLRTVAQHTDNPNAARRVARFKEAFPTWPGRGAALSDLLDSALAELATVAVGVSRNEADSARWKEATTLDLAGVFNAVATDLGLNLPNGRRAYMLRQIAARMRLNPPNADRRRVVQDYCVQEITSETSTLPVPYFEVLDALGLLGTTLAQAAVMVAYSVSVASPSLTGTDFIARVQATWLIASSEG